MQSQRRHETWRDWQAQDAVDPGPLLSRKQFLEFLHLEGIDATENDMLFWQRRGVIPYPAIRRVGRTGIAVYPRWMANLIDLLRMMQAQQAMTLNEMKPHLRDAARDLSRNLPYEPKDYPAICPCCGQVLPESHALQMQHLTARAY